MRTLLTYCIGMPNCLGMSSVNHEFLKYVAAEACLIAGGCTTGYFNGYWVVGAEHSQEMYHGCTEQELSLKIEVLVDIDKADRVLAHMKAAIIFAAKEYDLDTDWVQVTEQEVNARYFSIAEDSQ